MTLRLLLAATAALAILAGPAHAGRQLPVVVVPGLELADLERLAGRGAVGLLVPGAGPEVSGVSARAALARGEVRNSLRGGLPAGRELIRVRTSSNLPVQGIVLGLPGGGTQANDRRYPVAVLGPGYSGLLVSRSTRLPGLVSIADVAPTALGREEALLVEARADPAGDLRSLDRRIRDNGRSRALAAALVALAIGLLALVRSRAAVLAFGAAAAASLLLGIAGVSHPGVVVALLVLSVPASVPLAAALRTPLRLGLVLSGVLAAYLAAMAADPAWVALSPLGPTQNARFYGFSNLLETMLLVPALVGAALLARRYGAVALAAVAALALVTVAGSRFGADGGGAIVLAAGYAILAAALVSGRRRTWLALVVAAGAVALVVVDALLGPATHVAETLRGGPDEVVRDLRERLELSWRRATDSAALAAVVGAALAILAVLVARGSRRPLPLAVAASVAVSLLVNDSPKEVSVGGLIAYLAVERLGRTDAHGYTWDIHNEESREQ